MADRYSITHFQAIKIQPRRANILQFGSFKFGTRRVAKAAGSRRFVAFASRLLIVEKCLLIRPLRYDNSVVRLLTWTHYTQDVR